jgi:germination protein M
VVTKHALFADDYSSMAKKKVSIGCLFWIVLILLVIVIVLANLKTANEIIKKTGFQEMVKNLFNNNKKENNTQTENDNKKKDDITFKTDPGKNNDNDIKESENNDSESDTIKDQSQEEKNQSPTTSHEQQKGNLRKALVYFAKINEDGTITLKGFERSVYFDDSPLRETILTLLRGPSSREINLNYYTLIPSQTQLINIYVKGSTAYLDFNDYFRFNPLGKEGLKTQLKQIVYTATEFSNVKQVQILIEGERVNYLGPEGIFIGEPLSRDSFIAMYNNP